jgi:hypothetical protein
MHECVIAVQERKAIQPYLEPAGEVPRLVKLECDLQGVEGVGIAAVKGDGVRFVFEVGGVVKRDSVTVCCHWCLTG